MTPDPASSDEAALKAAVCRAWACEKAPAALRRRIEKLIAEQASPSPENTSATMRISPSFWRRGAAIAAAALILIGVGVVLTQNRDGTGLFSSAVTDAGASALPADLGVELVRAHDRCVRFHPNDHQLFEAAPRDDFPAIARLLSAELNHPVIATAMGHDWEFRGAGICPVGPTQSAHMLYARGDAFVSVFSLPASAFPAHADKVDCDAAVKGHPVAGFAEQGAFYCVVGSTGGTSPMDAREVQAIRDQLRLDVVASRPTGPERFADARR